MHNIKPFTKTFALVDGNNFFASCEQVFNPKLVDKPVAILSNNDGCIIARSKQLKDLGVPMGAPKFKWNDFLKQHEVNIFSANFALYGDMSKRMMMILASLAPHIQIYSIDEAFLDCSFFPPKQLQELAIKIYKTIPRWIGIPVSVGMAPTKVLSKIANHLSKKTEKPFILHPNMLEETLMDFPINKVWGIGKKLTEKMHGLGVFTALDFYQKKTSWVRERFSITEQNLHLELQGYSVLDLEKVSNKKSICISRSFAKGISSKEAIFDAISYFLSLAVNKLQQQNSLAGLLHLFIQSNRFHQQNYYSNIATIQLFHNNETPIFLKKARLAFENIWKNHSYKKAGIILSDIIPMEGYQATLLAEENLNPKQQKLQATVNEINQIHGRGMVRISSVGTQPDSWKMNQQNLSPNYTTKLEDIIEVS